MNKRILFKTAALLLALVISAGGVCTSLALMLGDVNLDGLVNSIDGNLIKRVLSGAIGTSDAIKKAADINTDGKVNSLDSNLIAHMIGGTYVPENPEIPDEPVISSPALTVEKVSAAAGETVEVAIDLSNNPGILAMMLTLEYDDSALTLTGASCGDALSMLNFTSPGKLTSPCNFIWDGVELADEDVTDGAVLILTFNVAENASGSYPLSISYPAGGIITNGLQPADVNIINGSITVE